MKNGKQIIPPIFLTLKTVCELYIILKESDAKLKRWSKFGLLRYLTGRDDVFVLQLYWEGDADLLLEGGQRRQRPRRQDDRPGSQLGQSANML